MNRFGVRRASSRAKRIADAVRREMWTAEWVRPLGRVEVRRLDEGGGTRSSGSGTGIRVSDSSERERCGRSRRASSNRGVRRSV